MLTAADTGYAIAAVRADETELFSDPYAARFRDAGAHAAEGTARFMALPFFRDGIRLRTRFIDDAVRDGIAAGLEQLVILGAGFDARALRLPEVASVRTFEVDVPRVLEHKKRILGETPERIVYVAHDLTTEPDLAAHGFRMGEGATFVFEGVTAYLDDEAIDRTLRFAAQAGGPRSCIVFDYSFMWENLDERLRRAGFGAYETFTFDQVWRRYLPGEPHEHAVLLRICIARV